MNALQSIVHEDAMKLLLHQNVAAINREELNHLLRHGFIEMNDDDTFSVQQLLIFLLRHVSKV